MNQLQKHVLLNKTVNLKRSVALYPEFLYLLRLENKNAHTACIILPRNPLEIRIMYKYVYLQSVQSRGGCVLKCGELKLGGW